jgi:2-polyprenyl-6-hydroxyphenyl methylase/3-demethylubiquinone-9 3-methyltransferase
LVQPTQSWLAARVAATATTPAGPRPTTTASNAATTVTAAAGSGWLARSSQRARMRASLFDRAHPCQARWVRRNDLAQYDELAAEWWRPGSPFELLRGIAAARARLIPPPRRPGAVLVDLGCGAGLLTPPRGYVHIGVDLVSSALAQAREHGVAALRADVTRLPLRDGCADVVCAGELLEHVTDVPATVAQACRILRPGGLLILDTLNATRLARFLAVTVAERLAPSVAGLHDPDLFVDPRVLVRECARHGVRLAVRGLRPRVPAMARWLVTRRGVVPMCPTFSTAVLYQGRGVKE